jgi:hypothetical protein
MACNRRCRSCAADDVRDLQRRLSGYGSISLLRIA